MGSSLNHGSITTEPRRPQLTSLGTTGTHPSALVRGLVGEEGKGYSVKHSRSRTPRRPVALQEIPAGAKWTDADGKDGG